VTRRRLGPVLIGLAAVIAPTGAAADGEASALEFGVAYTADLLANVDGGLRRGEAWLGKLDLTLEADGSEAGLPGVTAFLHLQALHGPAFSERYVGDAQVISNIEAGDAPPVLEAWVEAELPGGAAVKAGLVDLNSEFDGQTVGGLFLNSSHGIGPDFSQSGLNGPSIFPITAGAVVGKVSRGAWSGRLGLFDPVAGDPADGRELRVRAPGQEGVLAVAEVERALGEGAAIRGGVWRYSTEFEVIEAVDEGAEPRRAADAQGVYATLEGPLDRDRALDGWVRLGFADDSVNAVGAYLGGGVAWGPPERRWGLAVAHARLGDPARRLAQAAGESTRPAETTVEATVQLALRPGVTLQPDVQWVINPSWRPDLDDALVVGLRIVLASE
jgi:porin